MRYGLLLIISFLTIIQLSGQSINLQLQINEQVWKPFIVSFNNRDDETFASVHSKDVVRVEQDHQQIFGYDEYFKKPTGDSPKSTSERSIELRFIQRIAQGDKAFEVGYYKTTSIGRSGNERISYGKFHVLLRKENEAWKIVMDADANEKTDETIFRAAKTMDEP